MKEIKEWVDVVKNSTKLKNYNEGQSGRIKQYEKFLKEKRVKCLINCETKLWIEVF